MTRGDVAQAQYFIVQKDDAWVIRFQNEEYGPYQTRAEAMLFAIEAAQKLGERGAASEVGLMGENGHFVPEWIYGQAAPAPV